MTIEELLDMPAPSIAMLSNDALENHLRCYFPLTRPGNLAAMGTTPSALGLSPEVQAQLDAINAAQNKTINLKKILG